MEKLGICGKKLDICGIRTIVYLIVLKNVIFVDFAIVLRLCKVLILGEVWERLYRNSTILQIFCKYEII